MVRVILGIGSNVGDLEKNIFRAIELISANYHIEKLSSIYKTSPVGFKDQPFFLNAVLEIETKVSLEKLYSDLLHVEEQLIRKKRIKNGPRTIDIDILFYGADVIFGELCIPHPRLHQRKFVLEPLVEICPQLVHPILKKNVLQLYTELKSGEVVMLHSKIMLQFS